ncbi:MFS transporter [Desulfallas sp. Bu1-1]|uniref:MFS transporter n=1 Tax=Desulfallas sp. Bu1-1 TaxID=2787620 RepID=UPI0018A10567|nr:MFS transporter [Desulfallas sp. Bu1-1]MBF7084709.1 MFS transporter [Desulfallas sp. Bu1-1]
MAIFISEDKKVGTGDIPLALYNVGTKKFFYGWVVLFLCFLALVVSLGIRLSFGVFVTSWEAEFHVNRGTLALISAIGLIFYGIFQPVAGRLSDLLGTRIVLSGSMAIIGLSLIIIQWLNNLWVLGVVYGILISIGYAGSSNVVASAVVIQWFHKRQGLALGFVTSGMAVGQMVIVPQKIS